MSTLNNTADLANPVSVDQVEQDVLLHPTKTRLIATDFIAGTNAAEYIRDLNQNFPNETVQPGQFDIDTKRDVALMYEQEDGSLISFKNLPESIPPISLTIPTAHYKQAIGNLITEALLPLLSSLTGVYAQTIAEFVGLEQGERQFNKSEMLVYKSENQTWVFRKQISKLAFAINTNATGDNGNSADSLIIPGTCEYEVEISKQGLKFSHLKTSNTVLAKLLQRSDEPITAEQFNALLLEAQREEAQLRVETLFALEHRFNELNALKHTHQDENQDMHQLHEKTLLQQQIEIYQAVVNLDRYAIKHEEKAAAKERQKPLKNINKAKAARHIADQVAAEIAHYFAKNEHSLEDLDKLKLNCYAVINQHRATLEQGNTIRKRVLGVIYGIKHIRNKHNALDRHTSLFNTNSSENLTKSNTDIRSPSPKKFKSTTHGEAQLEVLIQALEAVNTQQAQLIQERSSLGAKMSDGMH